MTVSPSTALTTMVREQGPALCGDVDELEVSQLGSAADPR